MAITDISGLVKSSSAALPQVYAYTTPELKRHDGYVKIGYTEQDVLSRIKQQSHTADVECVLQWHGNAVYEGSGVTFRDKDFHAYLSKLGYGSIPDTEWFQIGSAESKVRFFEFRENRGVVELPSATPYSLRAEQAEAVRLAAAFAASHEHGEFLWNAKPRFGKTLAAYDLVKSIHAKTVLIVTNRPAIANSWYDDFVKFLGAESGYYFSSEASALKGKPHVVSREEFLTKMFQPKSATHDVPGLIEFISLQDLKGSLHFGGKFDKLDWVPQLQWDVLIIDEAHEGVDTFRTDVAFDQIKRKFTLHLSGTPFKAIANDKFPADAIFDWTYADEQKAKEDWDDPELPNPYADLPRLSLFTYQMSDIIEDEVSRGTQVKNEDVEYAFDLNEFFATRDGGGFIHGAEVDRFLNALTTQTKFPFSTEELRGELKHTLWILSRVDSAKALVKKLKAHPVFGTYEIVLAAGDGKLSDDEQSKQSLDKVKEAIKACEKTITISVGQLTTGVTIPEWTAVLMLSNMKSPALYMQAAFRAQNPCLFYSKEDKSYRRKTDAYVFDFDPARTLTIFEEFANDLSSDTAVGKGTVEDRERHIRELLNFFPVIGEDENGEMIELDAEKVLSIPRKIRSQEVVRRGFMSDFLFQNISCIFRAPSEVIDIITKFEPQKEPAKSVSIDAGMADELCINDQGEVEVPDAKVIGMAAGLFGPKVYKDLTDDLSEIIGQAKDEIAVSDGIKAEDEQLAELKVRLVNGLVTPIIESAQEGYGDIKAGQRKKLENKLQAVVNAKINHVAGGYGIERSRIEQSRKDELGEALTQLERDAINQKYDGLRAQARDNLETALKETMGTLAKDATEALVREVETSKRESEKKGVEDAVRDHLRGFSRTIPSFLMAYGDEDTTLASFDTIIPEQVFEDVTSITIEQFRFLRDGGDYIDSETGETRHFDGHLFDPLVFDDSVKEFIRLRSKLADYFDESQVEDIFDYVPPQRTNQIFTPKAVVKQMVDMLEEQNPGCYDEPTHTFIDPYMKSGLYITEIVKRLYNSEGMKRAFPDGRTRLNHIFEHQVFGIAPTEIIYQIATHFILGYDGENSGGCKTHFVCADSAQLAKEGKLAGYIEATFGADLQ